MVFEVTEGRSYIYQPEQRIITYADRPSRATVSEYVVFRYVSDSGMYVFERRDGSLIELKDLRYIFMYLYEVLHIRGRRY